MAGASARQWRLSGRGRGRGRAELEGGAGRRLGLLQQDLVHVVDGVAQGEILLQHQLGRPHQVQTGARDSKILLIYSLYNMYDVCGLKVVFAL